MTNPESDGVRELLAAAKFMLAALPEGVHEKYLDESLPCPCTCPRCRLKRAVRKSKGVLAE